MEPKKLPLEILSRIIVEVGREIVDVSPAFKQAYEEYQHLIHSKWLAADIPVHPITPLDLKQLGDKVRLSLHVGVSLLHSTCDDAAKYAIEHNMLQLSQHDYVRLIGRPELMSLVDLPLTSSSLATPLFTSRCELSPRLKDQVFHLLGNPTAIYDACEEVVQHIKERNEEQLKQSLNDSFQLTGQESLVAMICNRLYNRDIAWFITFLDRSSTNAHMHMFNYFPAPRLHDIVKCAIDTGMRWNLYTNEWYMLALDDLELARAVSTDARLDPMAKSLYHQHERPANVSLGVVPSLYHYLFVEQWPSVEFMDVNHNDVALVYTKRWGSRYGTSYVSKYFHYPYSITPQTTLAAINVVSCIKYRIKLNWASLIRLAIEELINHSPDGSYTSWFDRQYPDIGDGGKELGMKNVNGWLVPNFEIENGVPESLPRTRILLYLIEHTTDYIYFEIDYLNLPPNIFRILRKRLVYMGQPFTDDKFPEIVLVYSSGVVFVEDQAGRWPSMQQDDDRRRSALISWSWIHTNNLKGLDFSAVKPLAEKEPIDPYLKELMK